jgi:hypothetical protein
MDLEDFKAQAEVQTQAQVERAEVIERHLHWLRNAKAQSWSKRNTWFPSSSDSEKEKEDIRWGQTIPISESPEDDDAKFPLFRDKVGSQTFKDALQCKYDIRDGQNCSRTLSHIEVDVQGLDAKRNRLRVQQILEVGLKLTNHALNQGDVEKTTMSLKRVLKISRPDASWLPPSRPDGKEVYHAILEQLAQHEVDKALDERNHYLREVFGQEVDHVRVFQQSTIAAHEWHSQRRELWIQGPDGTRIGLREKRTDSESGEEVILTHTIMIEQERGENGRNRLFDLPADGTESERRIREARWSISSAIDRCMASGAAERFLLDRWVDGVFLSQIK